jgi:hypothetical protein
MRGGIKNRGGSYPPTPRTVSMSWIRMMPSARRPSSISAVPVTPKRAQRRDVASLTPRTRAALTCVSSSLARAALFDAWCRERGLSALPAMPATVCAFLAAQAGLGKRASN